MSDVESLIYNFTEVVESFRDTVKNFDSDLERVSNRVSSLESTLTFVVVLQISIIVLLIINTFHNRNNKL